MTTETTGDQIKCGDVMVNLSMAIYCLAKAKNEADDGFIFDHCENAISEINKAVKIAIYDIGGDE
jgi:hypothetical protein